MIDLIVVVIDPAYSKYVFDADNLVMVPGGKTRNESLYNALIFIRSNYICDKVIILESARPLITTNIVTSYLELLDDYDAVITGKKITDSLGNYHTHVIDRDDYYLIQAPEAFRFQLLISNFDKESKITATNQQLPEDSSLYINFDYTNNIKITYPGDLFLCEQFLRESNV